MTVLRADSARSLAQARATLVDAAAVAEYLGVDRGWVYEHADELGARRLPSTTSPRKGKPRKGDPRPRLRFSLEDVDLALTGCTSGRRSTEPETAPSAGSRRRRRTSTGTNVELLPIRGRISALEGS